MATTDLLRTDPTCPTTSLTEDVALAERIEECIAQKACGRIRDLRVVCENDRIILQGRSRTYHAKQLALDAALTLADGYSVLANQIIVC